MADISVRLADKHDLDTLCELYFEFHEFHVNHLPNYLCMLDKSSLQEQEKLRYKIMEIMERKDSAILVAGNPERVIGLAEVYLRHTDPDNPSLVTLNYAHLQSLMVTQDFRGQGIGNQLIKAVEAWAREQDAVEIRLEIWDFSAGPAIFYEQLGYHTMRRTLVKHL